MDVAQLMVTWRAEIWLIRYNRITALLWQGCSHSILGYLSVMEVTLIILNLPLFFKWYWNGGSEEKLVCRNHVPVKLDIAWKKFLVSWWITINATLNYSWVVLCALAFVAPSNSLHQFFVKFASVSKYLFPSGFLCASECATDQFLLDFGCLLYKKLLNP